jgi:3-dehydroquinate synthase
MSQKISVDLGSRSYEILVGINSINNLQHFLESNSYSKLVIISDKNVYQFHRTCLIKVLNQAFPEKIKEKLIEIEVLPGEGSKSFRVFEEISEKILQSKIDRKSLIIAFGGGVVGDLAGFIASTLLRGIDFIQIPTTLLAMVDSSVGGKTAINSSFGKNLIGSFYQPKLVICDLQFLQTLPKREFLAGYAEIIKYGIICDKDFFNFLSQNRQEILDHGKNRIENDSTKKIIEQIIVRSCQIKAKIVGCDEKESAQRALLNFGHSFGHIFETETNYSDELLHGEAVALGMAMAVKMSQNLGLLAESFRQKIINELENCGFILNPKKIRQNWDKNRLTQHLFADKKTENGQLTFILLEEIGAARIAKNVSLAEFSGVLDSFID